MVSLIKEMSKKNNENLMNADLRQIKAKIMLAITQINLQNSLTQELVNHYERISEIIAMPIDLKIQSLDEVRAINQYVKDVFEFTGLSIALDDLKIQNRKY